MFTEYSRYRIYEFLPGLSVWLTIIGAFALSFIYPLGMIYAIILFDIYWVLKVFHFSFYLLVAWRRFYIVKQTNWHEKLVTEVPTWNTKRHVIFLTLYNETWDVVETALVSLAGAVYDPSVVTIVVAGEARKADHFHDIFGHIQERFKGAFADIVGTLHPTDLPHEIPGKGSNLHYAERQMVPYIEKKGWNPDDVIVTIFDIDTVCHPAYLSYLTYIYATHPNPTHSSYQPVALYNNNMWESPAMLRVMAFGTTFWLMTSLARQDALVTFSSHAMSWTAILKAGFHDKRIVSEDSRIFYQCLLAYGGKYEVTPLYIPVSMDTVRDDKWWQSMVNLYKQQRRWAWGAEHIPYLLHEFKKHPEIPWHVKVKWIFLEWEGKWSWCCVALLITVLGRLPLYIAPESVRQSALYFNAPTILETLMTLAMVGLLLSAICSFPLLPKRPKSHPRYAYVMMVGQWLLLPFSLIFVSAIPAIDALTHLMRGKYLGFNVSQKKRQVRT